MFPTFRLHSITSQSKILITSRPDSSVDLHGLANRVVIVGFTEENIHEYFKEALSTELDHDKVEDGCKKLQDHFRSYPVIQSCCSIPLNAAILANLYLSEQSLPSTRHGLFLKLVLSRINRELQKCHSQQDTEYMCVSSLDELPRDLRDQLIRLSILAFEGVKQNKVVFTKEDLVRQNLPSDFPGLGVLQIVDSFVATGGKTAYRYFIHLSLQELLAAYLISQLGEDDQVKVFESYLDEPRFSAVLQFYAAFTKFANKGVQNIITRSHKNASRLNLLCILRCLFEAQTHDQTLHLKIIPKLKDELHFAGVRILTPLDCISIGYFMAFIPSGVLPRLEFINHSIDDYMLSLLVGEFSRCTEVFTAGVMERGVTSLCIIANSKITAIGIYHVLQTNIAKALNALVCGISNLGMETLARALAVNRTLEYLDISSNNIGDAGIAHIANALLTNATLKTLRVRHLKGLISHSCAESLARALADNCSSLKILDIADNNIGDKGIAHIANALLTNTLLKQLSVQNCDISGLGAESLARALAVNCSLEELDISHNNIGDNGIAHIATILQSNTTLESLFINRCGMSSLGTESIARALAVNRSLKELVINSENIGDDGVAHIAQLLRTNNSTLEILCIGKDQHPELSKFDDDTNHGLTDTAVLSLATCLATNTSLKHLIIRWCSTEPDSALKKMTESVKESSVKTLELWISMFSLPSVEAQVKSEKKRVVSAGNSRK